MNKLIPKTQRCVYCGKKVRVLRANQRLALHGNKKFKTCPGSLDDWIDHFYAELSA